MGWKNQKNWKRILKRHKSPGRNYWKKLTTLKRITTGFHSRSNHIILKLIISPWCKTSNFNAFLVHVVKKDWHRLMKMQQNQMKNQKKLNRYRILSKSVASIGKWLKANMNRHYRTLGLGLNIISICQLVISHF